MKKFTLGCTVTVSATTSVVAETLEEAISEAQTRSIELMFNGCGHEYSEVWGVEEADGMAEDITLVSEEDPDEEDDE
jgi:hypothetical protein